jgi:hypothetical protein
MADAEAERGAGGRGKRTEKDDPLQLFYNNKTKVSVCRLKSLSDDVAVAAVGARDTAAGRARV